MAAAKAPSRPFLKIAVALVLIAGLAFVFLRSVRSARSGAYTVEAASLRPWTLSLETATSPNDPVLVLRAPSALAGGLFDQVFKRSMESMRAPDVPGIALVLQGEIERAGPDRMTPTGLLAVAKRAGVDTTPLEPRCVGHRRGREPDTRQQLYFAIFDSPAFARFREALGVQLGGGTAFNPTFLSPVLPIGTIESGFSRWLPLTADPATDCVAPIRVTGAHAP
jgi:hypothetical protein